MALLPTIVYAGLPRVAALRLGRYAQRAYFRRIRTGLTAYLENFLSSEAAEEIAEFIITRGIYEAIVVMSSMPVNPGQEAVFEKYVIPAFENLDTDPESCDPEGVYYEIPSEYLEFMSDIVSEGVEVVLEAVEEANNILEAAGEGDDFGDDGESEE